LLAVLTLLAAASFNLGMLVMVLSLFCAAPLVVLWVMIALVEKNEDALVSSVLYLGALLLMLPVGYCTLGLQHHFLDLRMQPLITALDAHQQAHGRYPAALEELELPLPSCSALGVLGTRPMYHQHEGSYSVTCMTFGFNHHTYRPAKRRWENWD
jgi:hypothetical protein